MMKSTGKGSPAPLTLVGFAALSVCAGCGKDDKKDTPIAQSGTSAPTGRKNDTGSANPAGAQPGNGGGQSADAGKDTDSGPGNPASPAPAPMVTAAKLIPSTAVAMEKLPLETLPSTLPACPAPTTDANAPAWKARRVVEAGIGLEARVPIVTNWNGTGFESGAGLVPPKRNVDVDTLRVNPSTFSYADTDNMAILACKSEQWEGLRTFARMVKERLGGAGVRVGASAQDIKPGHPAFQVLPNQVFKNETDAGLITWVLPPNFDPKEKYPVVISGGGYTVSNNAKLLAGTYTSGVYVDAHKGLKKGFILAMFNSGGKESVGIHPSLKTVLQAALAWGQSNLGVDPQRVVLFGGSRSGITATSHATWLNEIGFKVNGIFANVPYPKFGTEIAAPVELIPYNLASQYNILFGSDMSKWLPWALGRNAESSEIAKRILGVARETDGNRLSGLGQLGTWKALAREGFLKQVHLGYGTRDPNQLYSSAVDMHRQAEALGDIPLVSYFAFGHGHEGAGQEIDAALTRFMAHLESGAAVRSPASRVYMGRGLQSCVDPRRSPMHVRLPYMSQKGRKTQLDIAGPQGADWQVQALDAQGAVRLDASGVLDASGFARPDVTLPGAAGTYTYRILVQGKALADGVGAVQAKLILSDAPPRVAHEWMPPSNAQGVPVAQVVEERIDARAHGCASGAVEDAVEE